VTFKISKKLSFETPRNCQCQRNK